MPLLCVMWSCAFVWLSGMPLMAWMFAIFCILYGAATLVLRCFYRTEVSNISNRIRFSLKFVTYCLASFFRIKIPGPALSLQKRLP